MLNNYNALFITDYPETWDLSNIGKDVVTFFDVDELSTEYTSATKRFNETIGSNVIITRVQRIQNPSEYARYQSLKKTWRMLHGKGSVHEKELFHGTKRDKVEPICSTGFNRGYAADSNGEYKSRGRTNNGFMQLVVVVVILYVQVLLLFFFIL